MFMIIRKRNIKGYVRGRTVTLSLKVDSIKKLPEKFVADVTLGGVKKAEGGCE